MLQDKIPYESSIYANQRIRFTIEKSLNGDTVTFTISVKLDNPTTAVDSNGITRKAGVRVGTVMLTEFKN